MTNQPNDAIDQDAQDAEWCPECSGDDVIELDSGNLWCNECRIIIDY